MIVDRHGLAFSRPLVQGQVSAPRTSEAMLSAATKVQVSPKSKNYVAFCVKSEVYPSKFRSKDVKIRKSTKQRVMQKYRDDYSKSFPEFSSSERDIIGEPYR